MYGAVYSKEEDGMIQKKLLDMLETSISQCDGDANVSDAYSLRAIREHAFEVQGLFENNDEHWKAEAVDLCILCLLLLKRHGGDIDALTTQRVQRFMEKITHAIAAKKVDE